ncbi:peptide chain release factor 1-like, mitochondrial [Clavelina lepadiformis]|uniref:peptide chain release factor 1-like, mitochondrial n=1 Tax=Clavelina lepadiformis TaxID=159417 RepID=UPI004042AE42
MSRCLKTLWKNYSIATSPEHVFKPSISNKKLLKLHRSLASHFCFTTYNRTYSSGHLQQIDSQSLSKYARYLLQIRNQLFYQDKNNHLLKNFHWPALLYDELGGKSNSARNKLKTVAFIAEQLQQNENELDELSALGNETDADDAFQTELKLEMSQLENNIKDLKYNLVDSIVEDKELEQCEGAILEVGAGVGGEEAMLFASELYQMYMQFCYRHGLEVIELNQESENESGLLKASVSIVSPDGFAYQLLRHEAGVHRVQRVPKTESRGRIHTSTASVAVIPKHDTSSFKVNPNEIQKFFGKSPGGGGQHVNKTLSCALVKHVPTGIQVKCHATRFQLDNLNIAMEQLTQILYKRHIDENRSRVNSVRCAQTKSRERSDKIRTYNFHQNRITDHRIGYTVSGIESFLNGGPQLETLLNKLEDKNRNDEKAVIMNALVQEAEEHLKNITDT